MISNKGGSWCFKPSIILDFSWDIRISKARKLSRILQPKKRNLPDTHALGGKLIARKILLLNKLLLCILIYVSLLSQHAVGWLQGGQGEKSVYEICQTLSSLTRLLFRPASHNWIMTLYPVFSSVVSCANTASWPKLGSADQMHHRVLERGHGTVLELEMCL